MSKRVAINKEVAITAVYFHNSEQLKSFPKRMEFEGREYTFIETGLRYLIQKGQRLIQVFDMTDGHSEYRLRFDSDQKLWTLVDMSEAPRAMA